MNNRRRALMVLLVAAAGVVTRAQQTSPPLLLEAARKAEVIDGDLPRAIEQYRSIVDRFPSDRAVAADALVRLATAYQKLGDAQARTVYERVLREYADQTDAVTVARAALGAVASAAPGAANEPSYRTVWSGPDVDLFGTISPDGRLLSYTDWRATNNTIVRDLVAGTDRALTRNVTFGEFGYSGWSAISRDGRAVAFEWQPIGPGDRPGEPSGAAHELRIADLNGTGVPPSRLARQFAEGDSVRPFDWSPDGASIAVLVERRGDWSQIGILSVRDGSLKVLKSVDWRSVGKMVFSPDGRYVAYDLATTESGLVARVLVMAIDGSEEHVVVNDGADTHVMGWARDGSLVFTSQRSGARSLWVVPVMTGQPAAAARIVKENAASSWSLGLASSGALFMWRYAGTRQVKVAPIDLATGTLGTPDSEAFQQVVDSRGRPAWSADGKHLIFISCGQPGGGPCALFDRATDTGVVRQIPHQLRYLGFPRPSPDGRWLVTDGTDSKGRTGLFVLDAATGVTTVVSRVQRPFYPDWSPGGQAFHYLEVRDGQTVVVERTLLSEQTTELLRVPLSETTRPLRLSPDGRVVGYLRDDIPNKRTELVVRPVAGGDARTVLTAPCRRSRLLLAVARRQ